MLSYVKYFTTYIILSLIDCSQFVLVQSVNSRLIDFPVNNCGICPTWVIVQIDIFFLCVDLLVYIACYTVSC